MNAASRRCLARYRAIKPSPGTGGRARSVRSGFIRSGAWEISLPDPARDSGRSGFVRLPPARAYRAPAQRPHRPFASTITRRNVNSAPAAVAAIARMTSSSSISSLRPAFCTAATSLDGRGRYARTGRRRCGPRSCAGSRDRAGTRARGRRSAARPACPPCAPARQGSRRRRARLGSAPQNDEHAASRRRQLQALRCAGAFNLGLTHAVPPAAGACLSPSSQLASYAAKRNTPARPDVARPRGCTSRRYNITPLRAAPKGAPRRERPMINQPLSSPRSPLARCARRRSPIR